jgi:hypothetical protein
MYLYLASDLHVDPLPGDDDEFITVEAIPLDDVTEMVRKGVIQDAKSLAALFLAEPTLKKYL